MGQTQSDGMVVHQSHCPNKRIKALACPCRGQRFMQKSREVTWVDNLKVMSITEYHQFIRLACGTIEPHGNIFGRHKILHRGATPEYKILKSCLAFDLDQEILYTVDYPLVDYTHNVLVRYYLLKPEPFKMISKMWPAPEEAFAILEEWKAMYPNWKTMDWLVCLCHGIFGCEQRAKKLAAQ
jgi:hypothetical protein